MIRVGSINTWEGRLHENLLDLIEDRDPDILLTQEMTSSPQGDMENHDLLEQILRQQNTRRKPDGTRSELGFTRMEAFFSPTYDRLVGAKHAYFGNAVFAHYSINQGKIEYNVIPQYGLKMSGDSSGPKPFANGNTSGEDDCTRRTYHGNAICTKMKLNQREYQFIQGGYVQNYESHLHGYPGRNFQHAVVIIPFAEEKQKKNCSEDDPIYVSRDYPGYLVHVVNTHFPYKKDDRLGDKDTERQMDKLIDYIGQLKGPKIVAGDFNLSLSSASLKRLEKQNLDNLCRTHRIENTRTIFARQENRRTVKEVVDHFLVSEHFCVERFRALSKPVSDHKVLEAQLRLKTGAPGLEFPIRYPETL